ncbi:16S rRNA (guanine(966)-N(2))-methyltransferase RsmD [Thermodesulfobacteriota bacterium]
MGLRVIGGGLKKKKLRSVPGTAVRPTADRLRESIFNIIGASVSGAVVLDLFAGTGALGIEALSRGADFAVFIDNYRKSLKVIAENIHTCLLQEKTKLIKWNATKNLYCLQAFHHAINIVFIDPPYNQNFIKPVLSHLQECRCLAEEAAIIIEHSALETLPDNCPAFALMDQRRYGKTLVSYLSYVL